MFLFEFKSSKDLRSIFRMSKHGTLNRDRKVSLHKIWMSQSRNVHQASDLDNVIVNVDRLKMSTAYFHELVTGH